MTDYILIPRHGKFCVGVYAVYKSYVFIEELSKSGNLRYLKSEEGIIEILLFLGALSFFIGIHMFICYVSSAIKGRYIEKNMVNRS